MTSTTIIGIDDGRWQVSQDCRGYIEGPSVDAHPALVAVWLAPYRDDAIFFSSSVDFPDEYGVDDPLFDGRAVIAYALKLARAHCSRGAN